MLTTLVAAAALMLLMGRKKNTSNADSYNNPDLFEPDFIPTSPTTTTGGGSNQNTIPPPPTNSMRFQYSASQDARIAFKKLKAINDTHFIAFVFSPEDNKFLLSEPRVLKQGDILPGLTTGRTITDLNTGNKYYHVGFEHVDSAGNKKYGNIAAPVKDFQFN